MALYTDIFPKYDPGDQLFFFEVDSSIKKNTYSDSGLTTPNTNPVVADASGFIPDIHLDGIYDIVLRSRTNVTLDTRNSYGSGADGGPFALWLNDNTYNRPDIALGSDDEYYRSLIDGNQGNDPTSSANSWEQLQFGRVWNATITYASGDTVYYTDGKLYRSLQGTNLNNAPAWNSAYWEDAFHEHEPLIFDISASVDASALTVTLNPCFIDFRSDTITDGAVSTYEVGSSISITVPSGATLGTSSGVESRLVVFAIDDAGTPKLGIAKDDAEFLLNIPLITTTTISGAANSANVAYTTTSATDVPARLIGYVESTQSTAGTWAASPSYVGGVGTTNIPTTSSASVGKVEWYAMNSPPPGTLECDGAAISRSIYSSLFAQIGTVFGVGDGSTTFNIPDLRGEFIRGWDNGRGVDSGRVFGSSQGGAIQAHTHTMVKGSGGISGGTQFGTNNGTPSNVSTSSTGGAETRPRNVAQLPCITY